MSVCFGTLLGLLYPGIPRGPDPRLVKQTFIMQSISRLQKINFIFPKIARQVTFHTDPVWLRCSFEK